MSRSAVFFLLPFFLFVCAASAQEAPQETSQEKPFVLPEDEIYPGVQKAVREVIREDHKRTLLIMFEGEEAVPATTLAEMLGCKKSSLSLNAWLVSRHNSKQRSRELNENNTGGGFIYSCDNWSASYDQLINSNRGKATVLAVVWGTRLLEVGPFFLKGSIGYARVGYEVPRYNVTLRENSKIAYLGIGLKDYDRLTLNVAPVPKTAGDAYILWVTYRVIDF